MRRISNFKFAWKKKTIRIIQVNRAVEKNNTNLFFSSYYKRPQAYVIDY